MFEFNLSLREGLKTKVSPSTKISLLKYAEYIQFAAAWNAKKISLVVNPEF